MRKKGFTLIELLAVLVVLAIIALIAVPIVLNIIEKAREGAAIASAGSYIKATETYIVSSELDKDKTILISNNKYNVTTTTIIENKTYQSINDLIEVKGSLPIGSEDYVKIDENNQVKEALLTINGYVILIVDDEVVSITKGSIISVESITLDKTNETIKTEETLQLNATVTPNNATNKIVTWTSSDNNIATVDSNGLVMGIKDGNVTITATTSNGKTAKCDITVTSKFYLYKSGEEYNNITGGWNILYYDNYANNGYHNSSLDKFEKTNNYMRILVNANGSYIVNRYLGASTYNKIDVTNYTKLGVKYDYDYDPHASINNFNILLKATKLVNNSNWNIGRFGIEGSKNVIDEIKLIDISSYNGSYYIIPWINYSGEVKIKELWLE